VRNTSEQLLKVNSKGTWTIHVGRTAMKSEFLVVKALSVSLILWWDFQRNYVDTIFRKTEAIK